MNANLEKLLPAIERVRSEVRKVIIGQAAIVDQALIVIFTGHHALVEGVPGIAKTLLVRTLARVLGCDFARIQFTPDLMPSSPTKLIAPPPKRNPPCYRPCRSARSLLIAKRIRCLKISRSSRRKIRSSTKARIHYRKPRRIASC